MIENIKGVTPVGVAGAYPKLNEPNTKFNPEGVYSTTLILEEAAAQTLIETIDTLQEQKLAEVQKENAGKKTKIKEADKPYTINEDGTYEFKFKCKASGVSKKTGKEWKIPLSLFDKYGKEFDRSKLIYGGSKIEVSYEASPYYTALNGVGVSLRLNAVRVHDLKTGGGKDAKSYGFAIDDSDFEDEDAETEGTGTAAGTDANGFY